MPQTSRAGNSDRSDTLHYPSGLKIWALPELVTVVPLRAMV